MSASDEDRIAYLAGEQVESLTPDERSELDELRALLEAEAMWAEPPDELEDRVVAAIADAAGTSPAPEPTKRPGPRQFATPVQPAHVRRAAQEAQASQPPQPPPPARQAHRPSRLAKSRSPAASGPG